MRGREFETFADIQLIQREFEKHGRYFYPVEREHTEALLTEPLVYRLRNRIKKLTFARLAGNVAITFSGFAEDPREVFAIPEIRAYWSKLDRKLPELPALLTHLPLLGYNGP